MVVEQLCAAPPDRALRRLAVVRVCCRELDARERPAVAVTLVVGHQRRADGAIRGGLQAAVDRRRHLEPGRRRGVDRTRRRISRSHHLRDVAAPRAALCEPKLRPTTGSASAVWYSSTRDRARLAHAPQHVAAPRRRALDARERIPVVRTLRNAGQDRDLGDRELGRASCRNRFARRSPRRRCAGRRSSCSR